MYAHSFRKSRRSATAALAALLASAVMLVGSAVPAEAAVVKWVFKGTTAIGESFSQEGCIQTYNLIVADASNVIYYEQVSDGCEGLLISSVSGFGAPDQFITKKGFVRVVAVLDATDESGAPVDPVTIDNTFTAIDKGSRIKSVFTQTSPDGTRFTQRLHGLLANATVTGTHPMSRGEIITESVVTMTRTS
jgi:hypothetical protein